MSAVLVDDSQRSLHLFTLENRAIEFRNAGLEMSAPLRCFERAIAILINLL
jgi:hypothetical protein